MTATSGHRLGYIRSLDGLRGFAVLMVVGFHAFNWPRNGGRVGVGLFFVLSGFLITSLLAEEFSQRSTIRFRSFYARRALRLFPLLYASLAVVALSLPFFASPVERSNHFSSIAYCALYLGDFYGLVSRFSELAPAVRHFWSLAVEEQFYLVWPVIFLSLLRRRHGEMASVFRIVLCAIAGAVVFRALLLATGKTIWALPSTHADALLSGCALALLVQAGFAKKWFEQPRRVEWLVCGGLAVTLFLPLLDSAALGMGYVLIELLGVALLVCALLPKGILRTVLETTPLVYCGKISYGLYILHPIINLAVERHISHAVPGWIRAVIAIVVTFALSAASRRWFEGYFLRLKERRFRTVSDDHDPVAHPASSPRT